MSYQQQQWGQQPPQQQYGPPQGQQPPQQQWGQQPQQAPQQQWAPPQGQQQYGPPQQQQQQWGPPQGQQQQWGQPSGGGSLFHGVEQARGTINAEYVKPGRYLVKIQACKIVTNHKGEQLFAIEGDVVAVLDNNGGAGHGLHDSITHAVKRSSHYFLPESKSFVAAATDTTVEAVTEQQCNEVFGPQQPLTAAGTVMELEASQRMTQKNEPFTKVNWKRSVPAAELLVCLAAEVRERHFPHNSLYALAQHDQQARNIPVPDTSEWGTRVVHQSYSPQQAPQQQQWGQQQAPAPQQQQWGPSPQQAPSPAPQQQQWGQPQGQQYRPAPAPETQAPAPQQMPQQAPQQAPNPAPGFTPPMPQGSAPQVPQ